MATPVGLSGIYTELYRRCHAAGGQGEFAKLSGVSEQYISHVLNARRDPGPKLLAALGYRKVVMYAPVNRDAEGVSNA